MRSERRSSRTHCCLVIPPNHPTEQGFYLNLYTCINKYSTSIKKTKNFFKYWTIYFKTILDNIFLIMSRPFKERKSPTGEDGKRECINCKKRKELNHFYKSYNYVDGYTYLCKMCYIEHRNKVKEPKAAKKEKIIPQKDDMAKMTQCSKQDYMDMYDFFKTIGYDITQDISQQFCEKHDLKYKHRRPQDFSLYSSDGKKNPLHRSMKGKLKMEKKED
jgi:hypothetical protein